MLEGTPGDGRRLTSGVGGECMSEVHDMLQNGDFSLEVISDLQRVSYISPVFSQCHCLSNGSTHSRHNSLA